ncbi:hypothetical protein [Actinoalloteichus caeruleus]|uniref:hypothetical protein n=1 Tax=Actinoalloteichus cyanogriseus TaxID=2893586 RepID=UPI0004123DCE|nr:hypothetical protein [Actinoalloteichus caeruleus]
MGAADRPHRVGPDRIGAHPAILAEVARPAGGAALVTGVPRGTGGATPPPPRRPAVRHEVEGPASPHRRRPRTADAPGPARPDGQDDGPRPAGARSPDDTGARSSVDGGFLG